MEWVGSFRTRPGTNKSLRRFHPNDIYRYLRIRIIFFSLLLPGIVLSSSDLSAQKSDFKYDTIRFANNKFVRIGEYYSNSRIAKGNFHSSLFRVSTELHYLTKQNTAGIGLSSFLGLGGDMSGRSSWQLEKGISHEEMRLIFKIEMFCRGLQSKPLAVKSCYGEHNIWAEQPEPILEWEMGATGYIWNGDKLSGEFQMTLNPEKIKDSKEWVKNVHRQDYIDKIGLTESIEDFAIYCNLLDEKVSIIYSAAEDRIYLFNGDNLVGVYHPEKRKFLARKNKEDNPFLLVKENLNENERIRLLVLSTFSQWVMNVIYLY